ncbi:hypothetical protein [Rhodohalobacter sp.]|uniref:hypothetical protein n=1 Tax=Rhodohalobacter sp. TaxID=1974210 RepID=UPI00356307DA
MQTKLNQYMYILSYIFALLNALVSSPRLGFILCILLSFGIFMQGCSRSSNLDWNNEEGYRWAEISPGYFGSTGFQTLSSSKTGIEFNNRITREEID